MPRAAVRMQACQDSRAVSAASQMMVSPTVASADPALEVISKMRRISPGHVLYCRSLPALSDDLNTFIPPFKSCTAKGS